MLHIQSVYKLEKRGLWRVRYTDEKGKTRTKHFRHEIDARDWVSKQDCGVDLTTLTPAEKELVTEFVRNLRKSPGVSLQYASDAYKEDISRRNLRQSYRQNVLYEVRRFIMDRESWPVGAIRPESVVKYCLTAAAGDENQATVRQRIVGFLNWCKERGWTDIDTGRIRWRRALTDRRRVGFYTPDQVKALLEALPHHLRFPVALMFFTGIRPKGELMRLTYDAIDRKRKVIRIDEATSKTRSHRILYNLPENIWDWYALAKPKRGRVVPMNYRNLRANIAKVKPAPWPQDCSRHTFCSCAFHVGLEWAMDISGHRDSRIFMTRYKGQIAPEDAAELWAIRPV